MAYSLDLGFTPSSTPLDLKVDPVIANDFAVTAIDAESVTETALNAPMGRPETFQYGRKLVKDIYANASVQPAYRAPATAGVKVMVNWAATASLTSESDATFRQDFPLSIRTTVTVPMSDYISGENVLQMLKHALGGFLADKSSADRITKLLRGALEVDR